MQIRPELLEDVAGHVEAYLHAEPADVFACGTAVRVVGIRDRNRRGITANLGKVDHMAATVHARPEDLADGVTEAPETTALAQPEVARVLVNERRHHRLCHVVADGPIGIGSGEAVRIAGDAL